MSLLIIIFTPSESGALRRYHSPELTCESAGEYQVSEELAAQLCADFPGNFKVSKKKETTGGGGSKSAGSPEKNRAAAPPGSNK